MKYALFVVQILLCVYLASANEPCIVKATYNGEPMNDFVQKLQEKTNAFTLTAGSLSLEEFRSKCKELRAQLTDFISKMVSFQQECIDETTPYIGRMVEDLRGVLDLQNLICQFDQKRKDFMFGKDSKKCVTPISCAASPESDVDYCQEENQKKLMDCLKETKWTNCADNSETINFVEYLFDYSKELKLCKSRHFAAQLHQAFATLLGGPPVQ